MERITRRDALGILGLGTLGLFTGGCRRDVLKSFDETLEKQGIIPYDPAKFTLDYPASVNRRAAVEKEFAGIETTILNLRPLKQNPFEPSDVWRAPSSELSSQSQRFGSLTVLTNTPYASEKDTANLGYRGVLFLSNNNSELPIGRIVAGRATDVLPSEPLPPEQERSLCYIVDFTGSPSELQLMRSSGFTIALRETLTSPANTGAKFIFQFKT